MTAIQISPYAALEFPNYSFEKIQNSMRSRMIDIESYLKLLEKSLLGTLYENETFERIFGRDQPRFAHTMIGQRRLHNLLNVACTVFHESIAGDMIETGVWRGGACIYLRALIKIHNSPKRIFVADSFEGLPKPSALEDAKDQHYLNQSLAVSMNEVMSNFQRYDLLDDQVVFLPGWFKDTLPVAPIKSLSVMRLDGDMYESTMDALNALYSKLEPGGFCIIDDFGAVAGCQIATHRFREENQITDTMFNIDGTGIFWRKGMK